MQNFKPILQLLVVWQLVNSIYKLKRNDEHTFNLNHT
jgi:hypothetical protein